MLHKFKESNKFYGFLTNGRPLFSHMLFQLLSGHLLQVSKAKILAKQARRKQTICKGVDPNIFGP